MTTVSDIFWSATQAKRLKELAVKQSDIPAAFSSQSERDRMFQQIEGKYIQHNKEQLGALLKKGGRVALESLKEKISDELCSRGFTRVVTPTIISKNALARMTIDDGHPLHEQVYWLDGNSCLRPMLAPNLYSLMAGFSKLNHRPIRFFEIGSCFRKESDGAKHNTEFTMLNVVEMGTPVDERLSTLETLATTVARTAGLADFRLEHEESTVYGTTIDVVSGPENMEVASGAMGPHPLDIAWKISDTWVGLGFGIERLLMAAAGTDSIARWGVSLNYCNGIRLSF